MQSSEESKKQNSQRVEGYLALVYNQSHQQQTLQFPLNQQDILIINDLDETINTESQRQKISPLHRALQIHSMLQKIEKEKIQLQKEKIQLQKEKIQLQKETIQLQKEKIQLQKELKQIQLQSRSHNQTPIRTLYESQQSERSIVISRFPNVEESPMKKSKDEQEKGHIQLTLLEDIYPFHKLKPRKKQ